jgi:hypothetical protein
MMNMDSYTAHYATMQEVSFHTGLQDYLRLQMTSNLGMDKVSPKDITNLKDAGESLWTDNQEDVKKMLRAIIDERWAK